MQKGEHPSQADALEDLIEGANGKPVLVAYWFKHDLIRIQKRFKVRELKSSKDIADWNQKQFCSQQCGDGSVRRQWLDAHGL